MCITAQEEVEETVCIPGFQVKKYHVEYDGGFLKDQPVLQGRENVQIMKWFNSKTSNFDLPANYFEWILLLMATS